MTEQLIQIALNINAEPDTDTEELMELTLRLRQELLELDLESVELVTEEEIPQGSKVVEPVSWGTIAVNLVAAGGVITTFINVIQSWVTRNERQSITLKMGGDKLQITGISAKQQ